ncbi:hypothetical protein CPARA_3gp346 (nucleomorph) [Cryptomonas paramecium]|uniref:Uncharacterized protein n=1 Tax=Cryptomonas paramaecium TaxID=2898 RepID=F2HI80_9CRYP|nr:hypothetical protein CPARA_3gp346 [Cryptomonas paramecium]AEA39004.1 hypothetical protein CPARA_3gp346 [Cryptomonas paramecium]
MKTNRELCKTLSCFKLVVSLFLTIKKRNIPFQYIGIINMTCFVKNSFNIHINKNIFKFLKNIIIDQKINLSTGLSNFYNDLFLILLLKKNFNWIRFNYFFIKNTKGTMRFIYGFISNLNQDAVLLFLFSNSFKKKKFSVQELITFPCTKKIGLDFLIETNSKFNLLNLAGIEKSEIIFKKYLDLAFKTGLADLNIFYYLYKKQKKINACMKIANYIKNKKKISIEIKQNARRKFFHCYFINCLFFGIIFFFSSGFFFKKNTSYIFRKYILAKWTRNVLYLEIFLKEIAFFNFSSRTFDIDKKQTKRFYFPIFSIKKFFLNKKIFPYKFGRNKTELYNFCYILTYFSTLVKPAAYFSCKDCLFFFQTFLKFLYYTPDEFMKNKGYFFDLDLIFFYNNMYIFEFISKIIQEIDFSYIYKKKSIFLLKNSLDEGILLFFISNLSVLIYSGKIKHLIFSSINFYTLLFFRFQKNIQIWKNIKFSTLSLCNLEKKRNNFLNIKEYKTQQNLVESIFDFLDIYENFLRNSIASMMINFTTDFIIYTKKKMLEFFSFSLFRLEFTRSKKQTIFYVKKIIPIISKIQLEFFFCYKNKSLLNLLIFFFVNLFRTIGFGSIKVINSLEEISEKKFQKIYNLSAFFCINTDCVKFLSTIVKEYKKYEKMISLKIQRKLTLKNFKTHIYKNSYTYQSIDEYEIEKTFTTCKKYIEIGILQMSSITRDSIFSKMVIRIYNCLLLCHDIKMKTLIILSFGIFGISNSNEKVYNLINRFVNHAEWNVVKNTILSIGLVGIISKNTKIYVLLKSLASYYCNKIRCLGQEKLLDKLNFNTFVLKLKNIIISIRISQTLTKISLAQNFAVYFSNEINNNSMKYDMLLYILYTFSSSKHFGYCSITPFLSFLITTIRSNVFLPINEKVYVKPFKFKKIKNIYRSSQFKI